MSLLHHLWFCLLLTALISAEHPPPLLLPLHQILPTSDNNTHHLHLLKAACLRSSTRHHQFPLPLSPAGDYTISFSLGSSQSRHVHLYLDTGSDLVWLPCSPFECILCEGKRGFPSLSSTTLPSSSLIPCNSPSCSAVHSSLSSSDLCAISGCPLDAIETSSCSSSFTCPPFYYAYGDGSLIAHLRKDHLSIAAKLHLKDFTFGCANAALAEPVGVAGFGRGILSLPAQLSRLSPHLGRQFSYCLASHPLQNRRFHRHRRSTLILGRRIGSQELPFVYTPMLKNPKYPYFYTVGLEAVSVGKKRISSSVNLRTVDPEGNGGLVVDSGTTFTMLPKNLFSEISSEFSRMMVLGGRVPAKGAERETGLKTCFMEDKTLRRGVPAVVLHFSGNATVVLPERNYYTRFEIKGRRVGCLMMVMMMDDDGDGDGGPAGTLGNFQQQGLEVIYDLESQQVGFARRRCGHLWDSLSHGLTSGKP